MIRLDPVSYLSNVSGKDVRPVVFGPEGSLGSSRNDNLLANATDSRPFLLFLSLFLSALVHAGEHTLSSSFPLSLCGVFVLRCGELLYLGIPR